MVHCGLASDLKDSEATIRTAEVSPQPFRASTQPFSSIKMLPVARLGSRTRLLPLGDAMPQLLMSASGCGCDDGILLSVVLDGRAGRSCLLALDPPTLEPRARAFLPHHVPCGFHGAFFPAIAA
jgi:Retinal pigment epithelial membrane protein